MLFHFTLEIFDNVADLAFTKTMVALSSSIPPAAPDIEMYYVIQILLMIGAFTIDAARATHFFCGRADAGTICPASTVTTDIVYWYY